MTTQMLLLKKIEKNKGEFVSLEFLKFKGNTFRLEYSGKLDSNNFVYLKTIKGQLLTDAGWVDLIYPIDLDSKFIGDNQNINANIIDAAKFMKEAKEHIAMLHCTTP